MISVITAVYNNTKYLRACVESVIYQDYKDIEYIIVDDGSTDGTAELCDLLAEEDSRIRVIHQDNQWIYASFNNGIKAARGEYIYIVNSDDKICPGSMAKMMAVVDKFHPDVVLTKVDVIHCDEDQNNILREKKFSSNEFDDKVINRSEYVKNWKNLFTIDGLWNQANLYKRDLLLKHPFRTDWYGADSLMNLSLADDINSLYVMKDVVYEFYVYNSSKGNASTKWYGYEFEMWHEINICEYNLLTRWGVIDDLDRTKYRRAEMKAFSSALNSLCSTSSLDIEKKLEYVMKKIEEFTCLSDRFADSREEMEARTLSGFRKMFLKEIPSTDSKYYFVYELLDSLLRYEKDEKDFVAIHDAVNHELNPYRIGYSFEHKLSKGNCEEHTII